MKSYADALVNIYRETIKFVAAPFRLIFSLAAESLNQVTYVIEANLVSKEAKFYITWRIQSPPDTALGKKNYLQLNC